jgi:hypothetical protein
MGRPGLALAYTSAPRAVAAREEISRTLLDLIAERRSGRLTAGRELLARASELVSMRVEEGSIDARSQDARPDVVPGSGPAADAESDASKPSRSSPAERRLAARALLETWAAVARDLAVVAAGARGRAVDLALLDDLDTAAGRIALGAMPPFLRRLARAAELLEANANPELLVDVLVLAWPTAA